MAKGSKEGITTGSFSIQTRILAAVAAFLNEILSRFIAT